jgi:rhodanese-related sulfurtransferase
MKKWMKTLWVCALVLTASWAQAQGIVEPSAVPAAKKSAPDLYLMAKDVPAFVAKQDKVLFLDVRTRAEAMYVGMATGVDALVPFVEHQEIMTEWDAQRNIYKLDPNQEFVAEARRRLAEKGLQKTDVVVLICRSGDRSARAATRLQQDGFTRVYSVVDGFEGDMSPAGRRDVNGWKNAGLPWSYKLDKSKMFFVR